MSKDDEIKSNIDQSHNLKTKVIHVAQKDASSTISDFAVHKDHINQPVSTSLQEFGIIFKNIPELNNLSLLQATQENRCFSHSAVLQKVSTLYQSILRLQRNCSLIAATKLILQLYQKLYKTEKTLVSLMIPFDKMLNMLETSDSKLLDRVSLYFKTFFAKVISTLNNLADSLKESLQFVDTLLAVFHNKSRQQHYISKFRNSDCIRVHLHLCRGIINNANVIANRSIQLRNVIDNANSLIDSSIITDTVYSCYALCKEVQKLSSGISENLLDRSNSTQRNKSTKLIHSFVFTKPWEIQKHKNYVQSSCDVKYYITASANFRCSFLVKRITDASIDSIARSVLVKKESNNGLLLEHGHNITEKDELVQKMNIKPKKCVQLLCKQYKKIVSNEQNFFSNIIDGILDKNAQILCQNTNVLFKESISDRTSSKKLRHYSQTVHWETNIGPVQREYIFEQYMKTLWTGIKRHINQGYIESCVSCRNEFNVRRLNNYELSKMESSYIYSSIKKLDSGSNAPLLVLETLLTLTAGIRAINTLQQWDDGASKAMATYLKDRFRFVDTNDVGSPASQTINCILSNQVLVNELITTFQKKDTLINDGKSYHNTNIQTSIFLPLISSFNFLDLCLNTKRQQFLCSASWEPFFVITSVDMNKILYYCEFLLTSLKEIVVSDDEEACSALHYLNDILERWKVFKESSVKMVMKVITRKSMNIWKQHMPTKKKWRRRGSSLQAYEASTYINVALQSIFAPIIDCFNCLSSDHGIKILCQCIDVFIKTWMDHILTEQIQFSLFGSRQLDFDFIHLLHWFEQESFEFSLEEISEIHSLSIVTKMRNAIILLSCQPENRKKTEDYSQANVQIGSIASSASAISQVSIASSNGSQFDEVIREVYIHEKERWLALRVKGGQSKRQFLCVG